jgi:phosphatidylglycerol---prolipoprotein diacylglyceryl transferase
VIDPVALELGPLQVHWYGIIIALAVLVAAVLATRVAGWLGENPDDGWAMLLPVVIVAVIGARVYHVIHLWDHYSANPAQIPAIWNGGIGIPGAIAGGALAVWLYSRSRGLNAARWMDAAAPGLLLGQAIGRLGNFVNQELYGPPTSLCGVEYPPCLPFGIPIDAEHRAGTLWDAASFPVETTQFVPLFAYEAALNLIGLAVLLFVIRRFAPRLFAGDIVLMYIMWYGAVRSVLEGYRTGNWVILGIPTAMWLGILAFVFAAAWLVIRHVRGRGSPLVRPPGERDVHRAEETDAARSQPPSEAPAG